MKTLIGCPLFMQYGSSVVSCLSTTLFPPEDRAEFHETVLEEILQERVVSSRNRRNPRGVKRKMSNFPLRRRDSKPFLKIDLSNAIRIIK